MGIAQVPLHRSLGARPHIDSSRANTRAPLRIDRVDSGTFSVSDVQLPAELQLRVGGYDAIVIETVRSGTLMGSAPSAFRYERGDVFIGNCPQSDYRCRTEDLRLRAVVIPTRLVAEAARGFPHSACALALDSPRPVEAEKRALWQETVHYVDRLLASDVCATSPLVLGQAARMLAAVASTMFPATTADEPGVSSASSSGVLRRAMAYIDENAHIDFGLSDLARAAHASPRAVQYAFRLHLDTTPMMFLRRVRLTRAHRDLVAGDPVSTTVTQIAANWGFGHAGRFAAYYRQSFGHSPYATLSGDAGC
jgi:AraC-like DNA-binding protein